jgi:RHS repeat-associated protein
VSLANGTSTSYSYDDSSRLINQVESLAQGNSWTATISYNNVNEITGISHSGLGDDRSFGYSARRNLTGVTLGGPVPAAQTTTFGNDAAGNWVKQKIGGTIQTQYQTNGLNGYSQLTSYDASGNPTTTTLSYDNQDNLLGLNGSSFQFNYESQVTAGSNATNTVQSAYDGLGRCVSRTVNGVTTYIIYSGWSPIVETDSAGNIKDARVYGLGVDDLVVDLTPSLTPNFFYHKDASGNVQFLTDPKGNLIERYSYNPFGMFSIYAPNWNPLSTSSVGNRFYFKGREYLTGLGIYDFRNRAYSPSLGRFLQMDPIGFAGGNNLYRFAGNDPVNRGDPLGLDQNQLQGVTVTANLPQSSAGSGILVSFPDPSSLLPNVPGPHELKAADFVLSKDFHDLQFTANGTLENVVNLAGQPVSSSGTLQVGIGEGGVDLDNAGFAPSTSFDANGHHVSSAFAGHINLNPNPSPFPGHVNPNLDPAGQNPSFDDLVRAAQEAYPKKADSVELHHVIPKYLNGPDKGLRVPLNAAYHQLITNAFRALAPYGENYRGLSATQLQVILDRVYSMYPLGPEIAPAPLY